MTKEKGIKIICPNCEEDITYYYKKGQNSQKEKDLEMIEELRKFKFVEYQNSPLEDKKGNWISFKELTTKIKGEK